MMKVVAAQQDHNTESEILGIFWPLAQSKMYTVAVIQSAASAASARGGCASSRLDHGLKFYVIQGGCASIRLNDKFSDSAIPDLVAFKF